VASTPLGQTARKYEAPVNFVVLFVTPRNPGQLVFWSVESRSCWFHEALESVIGGVLSSLTLITSFSQLALRYCALYKVIMTGG
jgi:hypothetical protein